jgi:hypothetical protein
MSVKEVNPSFRSRQRNRRVAMPRRACLSDDRAPEEVDEMTLGKDRDPADRLELDVGGLA